MSPNKLLKVELNILPKIELVQLEFDSNILLTVENKPDDMQKAKYQDFADRLNELMRCDGTTIKSVNDLKDAIGVSYEMARRYTLGTAKPREEKLKVLADALHIDISYLDHGTGFDNNVNLNTKIIMEGRPVPVISWVAAGAFTHAEGIPRDTEITEWLPPNKDSGKRGFGLVVVGESMLPTFEPGDRIYVNPDFEESELKTGVKVIATCDGDTEATFKKLVIEPNGMYLQPLNPNWHEKIINLRDGCRITAKVVGLYRKI